MRVLVCLCALFFQAGVFALVPSRVAVARKWAVPTNFVALRPRQSRAVATLRAVAEDEVKAAPTSTTKDGEFDLQAWLDPNTRGGVIVWCFLLVSVPVIIYNVLVSSGMDESKVGSYVGAIFVLLSNLLWASTYVFRVANKDMTYAKQLRDYENAVLQKRLEELADDEIDALMQEIEEPDQPDESKAEK